MSKTRVIARLDIKNNHVIKGIQLEGLRKIGDPHGLALHYYQQGADEIFFMDAVASLYDRNTLHSIIERACKEVFIPLTVGGGIRTLSDIHKCLESGADKIAINTQALKDPHLITEGSRLFGSQCIVGSIESKRRHDDWECYTANGREPSGKKVIDWALELQERGAGEIFLTSVDRDGTQSGFEKDLIETVAETLTVPLVISGGAGNLSHFDSLKDLPYGGVALGSILHYNLSSVAAIKKTLQDLGHRVRT